MPERKVMPRKGTVGKQTNWNVTAIFSGITYQPSTLYDKGLFDSREIGYIY